MPKVGWATPRPKEATNETKTTSVAVRGDKSPAAMGRLGLLILSISTSVI